MPDKVLLLGIDVGTTGCKAVLIDDAGQAVADATHEYPLSTPRPGWSEQNPDDWWKAALESIRAVLAQKGARGADVRAVGLTGQMHGAVLLDRAGDVLRPAILWNDQRTAEQCDEITRRVGAERVVRLTGNPVLTGFTAPKLLWVKQNEPELFAQTTATLLPKDYVRFRLTGERFGDVSDASGTALFDVARRRWSDEMLEAIGVPKSWLATITESPEPSTRVNAQAATQTGLAAGIPVVAGAGDQAAQAVGSGVVREGIVSATLGTSGVVFAASDRYRVDPRGRLHAFCHAVPGMWHLMGVMLSAGGSLRWYRDTLAADVCDRARREARGAYELLIEQAAEAPAGCEGLTFLPYLTGERTPHADPHARGAFVGLTLRHNRSHLTRAVLEGVTFGMRDSLELMRELGLTIERVRASGGGARSAFWRQMLADVFGCGIATVNVTHGAAYGAALLAGVGAEVFPSVIEAASIAVQELDPCVPREDRSDYEAAYRRFHALYPALAATFHD